MRTSKLPKTTEASLLSNPKLSELFEPKEIAFSIEKAVNTLLFHEINACLAHSNLSIHKLCRQSAEAALIILHTRLQEHFNAIELIEISSIHSENPSFLTALMTGSQYKRGSFPTLNAILSKARTTGSLPTIKAMIARNEGLQHLAEELDLDIKIRSAAKANPRNTQLLKSLSPEKRVRGPEHAQAALLEKIRQQVAIACTKGHPQAAETAIELMVSKNISLIAGHESERNKIIATIIYHQRETLGPETLDELLKITGLSIKQLAMEDASIALQFIASSLVDIWNAAEFAELITTHENDAAFAEAAKTGLINGQKLSLRVILLQKVHREKVIVEAMKSPRERLAESMRSPQSVKRPPYSSPRGSAIAARMGSPLFGRISPESMGGASLHAGRETQASPHSPPTISGGTGECGGVESSYRLKM